MNSKELVPDVFVMQNLNAFRFGGYDPDEGRLLLTELLVKANAGMRNSHTEEEFMSSFHMLKRDRTLNIHGRKFIASMLYKHSNLMSDFARISIGSRA